MKGKLSLTSFLPLKLMFFFFLLSSFKCFFFYRIVTDSDMQNRSNNCSPFPTQVTKKMARILKKELFAITVLGKERSYTMGFHQLNTIEIGTRFWSLLPANFQIKHGIKFPCLLLIRFKRRMARDIALLASKYEHISWKTEKLIVEAGRKF